MTMPAVLQPMAALVALPPGDSDPSGGHPPEWGKAAPIGLLIILLMGVALFLLIKSMNRNLRRVPASFDDDGAATDQDGRPAGEGDPAEGPVTDGGDGDGGDAGDTADADDPADPGGDIRVGGGHPADADESVADRPAEGARGRS